MKAVSGENKLYICHNPHKINRRADGRLLWSVQHGGCFVHMFFSTNAENLIYISLTKLSVMTYSLNCLRDSSLKNKTSLTVVNVV